MFGDRPNSDAARKGLHCIIQSMTTSNKVLINRLSQSDIFKNYGKAFKTSTGLSVSIAPKEPLGLSHSETANVNPFCALMAKSNSTCASCLMTQSRLCKAANDKPKTITCSAGLLESAVPLKAGNEVIGFLRTGQVLAEKPTNEQFEQVMKRLDTSAVRVPVSELKEAYFKTPVLPKKRYDSMITMLDIFSQQLSGAVNQIMVQQENEISPAIQRAKDFIDLNYIEEISLTQIAQVAHMSSFYFCKMFKKETGLNFTEYLSRVRVEKAKTMLLNRNKRVSEIAYDVGFQTLTHFNRTFKSILGVSPSEYRDKLATQSKI